MPTKFINHTQKICESNLALFNHDISFDAVLEARGRKFKVLKLILRHQSNYFVDLFNVDEDKYTIDLNPDALDHLLRYFYTGKLDLSDVSYEIMVQIYRGASVFNLSDDVMRLFSNILSTMITVDNWRELYELTKEFLDVSLGDQIMKFVEANKIKIIFSLPVQDLTLDEVKDVLDLPAIQRLGKTVREQTLDKWKKFHESEIDLDHEDLQDPSQFKKISMENAKLITGKPFDFFDDQFTESIGGKITIDLGSKKSFNYIKFVLSPMEDFSWYFVRTSIRNVPDAKSVEHQTHSMTYGEQNYYLSKSTVARFVTFHGGIDIRSLEIFYDPQPPKLLNGFINPETNIITEATARVTVRESETSTLVQDIRCELRKPTKIKNKEDFQIQFTQPYYIERLIIHLWGKTTQSFQIEVNPTKFRSHFEPKIRGTHEFKVHGVVSTVKIIPKGGKALRICHVEAIGGMEYESCEDCDGCEIFQKWGQQREAINNMARALGN